MRISLVCLPDSVPEKRECVLAVRRREVSGVDAEAAATRAYRVIQLASRRFKGELAPHVALAKLDTGVVVRRSGASRCPPLPQGRAPLR
jgi:hypothetical protein